MPFTTLLTFIILQNVQIKAKVPHYEGVSYANLSTAP